MIPDTCQSVAVRIIQLLAIIADYSFVLVPSMPVAIASFIFIAAMLLLLHTILFWSISLPYNEVRLRNAFREVVHTATYQPHKCSHPASNCQRGDARITLRKIVQAMGLTPYNMDSARCDLKGVGERSHHMSKDLRLPLKCDKLTDKSVRLYVDSDYYHEDMANHLAHHPCVMYGFWPETVGGKITDGSFLIRRNDVVEVIVNGGARYSHKIWDWVTDSMDVASGFLTTTAIMVETRRISEHRILVCTVPHSRYATVRKYLPTWLGGLHPAIPLRRVRYCYGQATALQLLPVEGDERVSAGLVDEPIAVNLPRGAYVSCIRAIRKAKIPAPHSVQTYLLNISKNENIREESTHLIMHLEVATSMQFLRRAVTKQLEDVAPPPDVPQGKAKKAKLTPDPGSGPRPLPELAPDDPVNYQQINLTHHENGRVIGRATGPSLLATGNVAAVVSHTSEFVAKTERIEKPTADPVPHHCKAQYDAFAMEFFEHEFGDVKQTLQPWDLDRIRAAMTKPSQVTAFDKCVNNLNGDLNTGIDGFIKSEAVGDPSKPARIISQVKSEHKILYSGVTLAAAQLFKSRRWYAFGKKPAEIAREIAAATARLRSVTDGDFSKFDGTHGPIPQGWEELFVCFVFAPEYHERIIAQMRSETNVGARLREVLYQIITHRPSGTPGTSIFNTLDCVLAAYCALRTQGYSIEESFDRLIMYGGDDSLTGEINSVVYVTVCANLCCKLTVGKIATPSDPVFTFLARTYHTWGCDMSTCDIVRTLRKAHITCSSSNTPIHIALARKGAGLQVTDFLTPIVSDLADLMLRSCRDGGQRQKALDHTQSGINTEMGFWALATLKEGGGYPPETDEGLVIANVMRELDVTEEDVTALVESIRCASSMATLLPPSLPGSPWSVKVPTLYRGVLFQPGEGMNVNGDLTGASASAPS